MKLNKETQLGLMFCLHLVGQGKASAKQAAFDLAVSETFLIKVANRLRRNNLVTASRGPKGGYELTRGVTVGEVYEALNKTFVLAHDNYVDLKDGSAEAQSVALFARYVAHHARKPFERTVESLYQELYEVDFAMVDKIGDNTITKGTEH